VGPFAVMCLVFSFFAYFQNDIILFEKSETIKELIDKADNIELALV
jgi:hypothetical protein